MKKLKRIINGECNVVIKELLNDAEKDADMYKNEEHEEGKRENVKIDCTR